MNVSPQMVLRIFIAAWFLLIPLMLPESGICKENELIMVTEQWPPFRINDTGSPSGFSGIDIDLTDRLAETLGITIHMERCPWARALEKMRTGQADMITGIARTQQRETYMHYIPVSYCAVQPVFITQKGQGARVRSYEGLIGPSVGYSLRSAYFEPFNSDSRINKFGVSTEAQLLGMLALGRIDITIGTDPNISYDISRLGYRDVLEPTAWQPSQTTDLFVALSRKSTAMALSQRIEKALRQLMANGTVNRIISAYK